MHRVVQIFGLQSEQLSFWQLLLRFAVALIVLFLFLRLAGIRSLKEQTLFEKLLCISVVFILVFAVINAVIFLS